VKTADLATSGCGTL